MSDATLNALLFAATVLFAVFMASPLFAATTTSDQCKPEQGIMIDRDGNIIIKGVVC